jgi:ATP-dependent DNA helicase Rep
LSNLNPQQQAAVEHVGSPLLVLAGAGSGKTSVITRKIAWLIREHGLDPAQIAAVTFTNKAAREMGARVGKLLDARTAREIAISTFHTLGLNILRAHLKETANAPDLKKGRTSEASRAFISARGPRLDSGKESRATVQGCTGCGFGPLGEAGRRPGFSIYDAEDSAALLAKLARASNLDRHAAEKLRWQISRWKNDLVVPEQALASAAKGPELAAARLYAEYERHLLAYNAFDFDDLILKPAQLLRAQPEILSTWRRRVRYLLVDEYQDTNLCQYELVKLISGESGALTVVGDDDQSIYGWRGANPENLLLLARDYPRLRVIKLEQNYRSTNRILKAANTLIANNPHLHEKRLWAQSGYGDPLRVLRSRDEVHEAERVVSAILHHKFRHRAEFRDYAILFRENTQARALERVLREQRIPYFLSGASSFFDRTEVRDVLAYLKLLANPDDDTAFLRIVNTPRREIGPATLETLALHAGKLGASLVEAARDPALGESLSSRQAASLRAFVVWLDDMIERAATQDPKRVAHDLLHELHYAEWLRETCRDDKLAEIRMENVMELVDWLRRAAGTGDEARTLAEAVARLTLLGMLDKQDDNTGDNLVLMTLHAAKGLEFPHVTIVGMEEGLLPHHASLDEHGLLEERRLAYVGITRARQSLTFSFAGSRRRGGQDVGVEPSRFLQELPADDLEWDEGGTAGTRAASERGDQALQNLRSLLGGK